MKEECSNCKFWDRTNIRESMHTRRLYAACRRFPPQPIPLQGMITEGWADVNSDQWCGEWEYLEDD